MFLPFFSIALIALLGAMLPGPDFAIVTRNAICYSKKAGYLTAFGIGSAILIHMSYCILGLAIVISNSILLFNSIKYIGAIYLIYLGLNTLFLKHKKMKVVTENKKVKKQISNLTAFKQGFLCNLLNPKATIFFLSLFTVLIKPNTPITTQIIFALEIFSIAIIWFSFLTYILSHPFIKNVLEKSEKYIEKILGAFLISFGVALAFFRK